MSVVRLVRVALVSVVGWILVAPIAALIPKRRDCIVMIGRAGGQFTDNAKYFFLGVPSVAAHLRCVFITEHASVVQQLRGQGCEALRYPGGASIWTLLRCNVLIVDESSWYEHLRAFLLVRAKVVQLWHGIGCKRIERDRWRHETGHYAWSSSPRILLLRLMLYRFTGRWWRYAAVATTSTFYRDYVFRPAFIARAFPVTGYPRNDFAVSLEGMARTLAWSNVDQQIRTKLDRWRNTGTKLVLIAPTFRDSGTAPMQLDESALQALDRFATANNVEFLFKFHPSERNTDNIAGRHFHVCARDSDIYPVLPDCAALVTDYSSISMDFLLLDRPLLFLIPTDDDYTSRDRQLQFPPQSMMPGPIVRDWASLLSSLKAEWLEDTHAVERAELRRKAFDDLPQAHAVQTLIKFMREQRWLE